MDSKYVFVAGMHGNEKMPVRALRDAKIDFIFGNPNAYKRNVRFTEQDLNASFGRRAKTFESKRAAELLKQIPKNSTVIDFHTTGTEERPFAIVVDKKMIKVAAKTGIKKIVLMKHNIKKGHALINYRNGVSIEAGTHKDEESYKTTLKVVKSLEKDKATKVDVYEVFDIIKEPGKYINFKAHKSGFIPVLANEPAYEKEGIFGLKAKRFILYKF
jgi:hypothetical protein